MDDSMEVDDNDRNLMSVESVKVMAESVGIANLDEEVCKRLGEDLELKLKEIIQNATKFMIHGKREQLLCSDVDSALRSKNIEPLYGFECAHYIPLRHSSGGGKEIYYPDDQEVDLANIISSPLPKLPSEVTIRTHWLAVEGVQPSIPENPPPLSLQAQKEQALSQDLSLNSKELRLERKRKKDDINAGAETIAVKSLHPHSLSLEQQLYYKELTDASIGLSDSKRQEALNCISSDPGLYQLLPQLVIFIGEGIKVNISQRKLINLMNILKITKALMDNSAISIEKYLHNLIPALVSCLLNKQLCQRPESEDQWSLRDLAAKILASICKKYSNTVNNIQTRITKIYSQALCNNGQQGLAVHYGAVVGFGELSQESVVVCVVPRLKQEGELIKAAQIATAGPNKLIEQVAANKLQTAIQKYCVPHLIQSRPATDTLQSYQQDYGYLGTSLFNQVKSVRQGKTRPSPLTLGSPQVTVTKIQTPKGPAAISLGSPTLAGNLRLQITSSSPSSGGSIATIPVSLLSAVVNNPSVAQAVLASQLGSQSEALSSVVSTLQELTSSAASASNNNNNIKTTK